MEKDLKKIVSILVVLMPILDIYIIIPSISLGMTLFLIIVPLLFLLSIKNNKIAIKFPKYYFLFLSYYIILNLLNFDINSIKVILLYSLILLLSCRYFNLEYGLLIYKYVVYFSCIFFIIQELTLLLTGSFFSGLIPFLNLSNGENTLEYVETNLLIGDRPSSIFLEPSHFAQYLLPYLSIVLFKKNKNGKYISFESVVISIIFLMLQSGNGMIGLICLWLGWYLYIINKSIVNKKILLPIFIHAFIIVFALIYIKTDSGSKMFERTNELSFSSGIEFTSRGYARIFRGYLVYDKLPTFNKVIGLNKEEVNELLINSGFANDFKRYDYFNNIQTLLLYTGVIGLLIFFIHITAMFIKNSLTGKGLMVCLFVLSFVESFFLTSLMLFYIVIAFHFQRHYNKNRESLFSI